jgi:hypothetical protein
MLRPLNSFPGPKSDLPEDLEIKKSDRNLRFAYKTDCILNILKNNPEKESWQEKK